MKQKLKWGGIALLVILVLIITLQNRESVETWLLFVKITMPRAMLLFVMLAIGFVIGWITGGRFTMKAMKKAK